VSWFEQLQFQVSDTVTSGRIIPLAFDISIGGSLHRSTVLYIPVGTPVTRSIATHNTGRVQFSVSNYGILGLGDPSFYLAGGAGYDGSIAKTLPVSIARRTIWRE